MLMKSPVSEKFLNDWIALNALSKELITDKCSIVESGSMLWIVCFLVAYVAIVFVAYWGTILIEKYAPVMLGKR